MQETRPCALASPGGGTEWQAYLLVERGRDGRMVAEDFPAPDDHSALERAREVCEAAGELWQAGRLIARWNAVHA